MDILSVAGGNNRRQNPNNGWLTPEKNAGSKRRSNGGKLAGLTATDEAFIKSATNDPRVASILRTVIQQDRTYGFLTPDQSPSVEYLQLVASRMKGSDLSLADWEAAVSQALANLDSSKPRQSIDLNT